MTTNEIREQIEVDGVRRPTRNSEGRLIHPTPEGIEAFWRWFGDSRAADKSGRPIVVYHGADVEFSEFEGTEVNVRWGPAGDVRFKMNHFTDSHEVAAEYGDNVMPVYLSLRNPKVLNARGATWDSFMPFGKIIEAKVAGHDGILIRRLRDGADGAGQESTVYVSFDSMQIKSAVENIGHFALSERDIRHAEQAVVIQPAKRRPPGMGM